MPDESTPRLPLDREFWSQWNEMASKMWAKALENDKLAERASSGDNPFLESTSYLISALQHASEVYVSALHMRMPTLSDITRVAELVVNLEEKVDRIEDTIERVKEQTLLDTATLATITGLEQRLTRIESRLDTLVLQKRSRKRERRSVQKMWISGQARLPRR